MSPDKFEKQKDQLFLDFFSMYTRQFVEESKEKTGNRQTGGLRYKKNQGL